MPVRIPGPLKSPARFARRPLWQRGVSMLTPFEKKGVGRRLGGFLRRVLGCRKLFRQPVSFAGWAIPTLRNQDVARAQARRAVTREIMQTMNLCRKDAKTQRILGISALHPSFSLRLCDFASKNHFLG